MAICLFLAKLILTPLRGWRSEFGITNQSGYGNVYLSIYLSINLSIYIYIYIYIYNIYNVYNVYIYLYIYIKAMQSHCGDNWEGTLFPWFTWFIYITTILLLSNLSTVCVVDHLKLGTPFFCCIGPWPLLCWERRIY